MGGKTRNIANQIVLQQFAKQVARFFFLFARFIVAYGEMCKKGFYLSISFLHLPLLQVCLFSWRTKPPRICCLKLAERSCRNFPEDERGSGVQKIDWMNQKRLQ